MRNRRPQTSALLVAGAVVLLVSILIGQKLGDRVLLQTERRIPIAGGAITPVPQTQPSDNGNLRNWKRLQVVSVATDPAFPDPRVTRPPTRVPSGNVSVSSPASGSYTGTTTWRFRTILPFTIRPRSSIT